MNTPVFTVVIATYGRGDLIASTLSSVAQQRQESVEVLVVSDGPAAPGLASTVALFGPSFRLIETLERSRSQSGPNNRGWSEARGEFIAYLGHDDIWHTSHLSCLRETYSRHPDANFAVSGCLYFGAPGTGDDQTWVTGMFDSHDQRIPARHFFPPSALSHRRDLPATVARWSPPATSRHPVDTLFLLGAVAAGMRFASTNAITAFKFASALRYLSYLIPEDDEQREILMLLHQPELLEKLISQRVEAAVRNGGFMNSTYDQHPTLAPGEQLEINEAVRGVSLVTLTQLSGSLWIPAGRDLRGSDWYGSETDNGRDYRWSGPNPRPRLALPYVAPGSVRVRIHITEFASDAVRASLRISLNSQPADVTMGRSPTDDGWVVSFVGNLRPDRPSVLEFHMERTVLGADRVPGSNDRRQLGFAYLGLELKPVP